MFLSGENSVRYEEDLISVSVDNVNFICRQISCEQFAYHRSVAKYGDEFEVAAMAIE